MSWLPLSSPAFDKAAKPYPYDPEKAKALLKEAGYPDGFEFELTATQNESWGLTIVEAIIPMLDKVGIKVKAKPVEAAVLSEVVPAGDFQSFMWSLESGPDPMTAMQCFYSKTSQSACNYYKFNNKDFDKLYEAALSAPTEEQKNDRSLRRRFAGDVRAGLEGTVRGMALFLSGVVGARRRLLCRGIAFSHEAVKLFPVLGTAQFMRIVLERGAHLFELAAFLGQALEFLFAPFVKGDIACAERTASERRTLAAAECAAEAIGGAADVALETIQPVTPKDVSEHGETKRPEQHETDNHQGDGGRGPAWPDQSSIVHKSSSFSRKPDPHMTPKTGMVFGQGSCANPKVILRPLRAPEGRTAQYWPIEYDMGGGLRLFKKCRVRMR